MKLFMCFGGAAPVADDEAAADAAAARSRRQGKRAGRSLPLSFRWKCFFPGKLQGKKEKKKKRPSSSSTSPVPPLEPPPAEAKKRGMHTYVSGRGAVFGAFTASSSDSDSDSYPSTPARSSTASSSLPSVSGALCPPPVKRQVDNSNTRPASSSPAAGAAAVVLCLLMVVFCGRIGATLLTPTALYLFPWRWWPAKAHSHSDDDAMDSHQCDAAETVQVQRKVAVGSSQFSRNHKNN